MSSTGSAGGELDDHAYFQAIEEIFVRLRGAPLLLSPADWRVAREWHRRGIPLEFVERCLEEVFERRRERGEERKVRSLRYCAEAVEEGWREVEEMTAPGRRDPAAPPLDVRERLDALAAALPPGLPGRERLAGRLGALEGGAEEVEERLAALDDELLEGLEAELGEAGEERIRTAVERALAPLAERLPPAELEAARRRLRRRELRREAGAPVLSLFSPEAEPPAG